MVEAYKVDKVTDAPGIGAQGGLVLVKRVTFTVGEHGPFTEDFRPGEFIPATVRERLQAIADTIRQLTS